MMRQVSLRAFTAIAWLSVSSVPFAYLTTSALAAEGPVAAGPIGGTDIRSAFLPPPGLYGGIIGLRSHVDEINDGAGNPVADLNAVDLTANIGAPFFVYVPNLTVFDGSVGLLGVFPVGQECGQLVSFIPSRCVSGFGDPYFEVSWSRSFGRLRPPSVPGAFPIMQGLVISAGIGAVIPIGQYDAHLQRSNGISVGNNTFDLAPSAALTYTTPPIIADGTEFSAKFYWNNYWTNPATQYRAGSLLDIDFAVSEHIGRLQIGAAGVYLDQLTDDHLFGIAVPPDGRRLEYLALGGVANYDMAEYGASVRVKVLTTLLAKNCGASIVVAIGFAKKLH
jgi:hypothetical protein